MRYGLTMLMLVSMACGRTFALDMSEQVSFDIPPQRLASALLEFSHQAGVQVIVGQDVAEQTTTGIKGRHTIGQALEALLQHTTGVRSGPERRAEAHPGGRRSTRSPER